MTAAIINGPAHGPLPASSTPAIFFIPDCVIDFRSWIIANLLA